MPERRIESASETPEPRGRVHEEQAVALLDDRGDERLREADVLGGDALGHAHDGGRELAGDAATAGARAPRSGFRVSKTLSMRNPSSSSTEMSRRSSTVSSLTTRSDSMSLPSCSAGSRGSVSVACARSSSAEAFRIVLSSGSSPPPSMRTRVVDSDSTLSVTPPTVIRSPGFRALDRRRAARRSGRCRCASRGPRPCSPPSLSRTMRACWRESILSEIGRSFMDERPIVVTGRSSETFRAAIRGR